MLLAQAEQMVAGYLGLMLIFGLTLGSYNVGIKQGQRLHVEPPSQNHSACCGS